LENNQIEQELDLRELLHILRRRWWMVALSMFLVILLTVVYSFFIVTPMYQSSTTMMVGSSGQSLPGGLNFDLSDLTANRNLAETYSVIVDSRRVANQVIDQMALELGPGALNAQVNVSQVRSTEFIEITVTDPDPELAAEIANTIGSVFQETVIDIMQVDNVSILDEAIVRNSHVSPNEPLNIAIGAVLGIMLGVFIVFAREYLDNTVKTKEDVDRQLGLPVIASIPYMEK